METLRRAKDAPETNWYKTWGECPYCKKQFVRKGSYYRHITRKHE
jgi:hypothetical protein